MIRLIIEFSCIQNLSFLWLHPSLLLFTTWIIQLDVGGLRRGTPRVYCPQPVISQMLDLNQIFFFLFFLSFFFFSGLLSRDFLRWLKKGVTITLLFETIERVFFSPQNTDTGGQGGNEKILQLSLLQSHSRTWKNISYVSAFFCLTFFLHFSVQVTISNH